jgi:hypothetical protein
MVLEIIIGAVLIAFGIMTIYFSIEEGIGDAKLMGILILGLLSVGAGIFVLVKTLTLIVILKKITGLALAVAGLFFIIGFPDIIDNQPTGMGRAGVFIGIVLLVLGVWLLFF